MFSHSRLTLDGCPHQEANGVHEEQLALLTDIYCLTHRHSHRVSELTRLPQGERDTPVLPRSRGHSGWDQKGNAGIGAGIGAVWLQSCPFATTGHHLPGLMTPQVVKPHLPPEAEPPEFKPYALLTANCQLPTYARPPGKMGNTILPCMF